jgi:hypothetical protein
MFRRRLAPIAFVIAIALIGHEQCTKMHRTHATVVLDFDDVAPRIVTVDAEVKIGDPNPESAAIFHREAHGHGIGPCKFDLALPVDDAELTVDVDVGGTPKHVHRTLHLIEGATITVPLARDVR